MRHVVFHVFRKPKAKTHQVRHESDNQFNNLQQIMIWWRIGMNTLQVYYHIMNVRFSI